MARFVGRREKLEDSMANAFISILKRGANRWTSKKKVSSERL